MTTRLPEELRWRLQRARHWLVLSGSGVSAESGVPTFRDAQTGLWAKYSPEELATPQAFARDPRLVWEWYQWRRDLVAAAHPSPGHRALAELEYMVPELTLITQNVDGLHQRAGSRKVVEFHGNIHKTLCSHCDRIAETPLESANRPPRCRFCSGLLRPGVVWFGETIPPAALQAALTAAARADLFISVGTSSLVYPAAGLARMALDNGATVVEINPNQTPLTPQAHFHLAGPAGRWLPALATELVNGASADRVN